MRIAWLMLFPKDLRGRSFGNYARPISHCSFGIPGGSGSAWNRSSTTRIHSSARSPMSRLVNPVTDAPTVAPLAVLVDFVAGLVNHYRRASDEWAVSSESSLRPAVVNRGQHDELSRRDRPRELLGAGESALSGP